jgi:hypothetical protein
MSTQEEILARYVILGTQEAKVLAVFYGTG